MIKLLNRTAVKKISTLTNQKAWKRFESVEQVERLTDDDIMALSKWYFTALESIPNPKYKYPPVMCMMLDDFLLNNIDILVYIDLLIIKWYQRKI